MDAVADGTWSGEVRDDWFGNAVAACGDVTGGGRPKDPEFLWVNITLGNVKSAVTGTCRSLDERHVPRYLAAYEWRYNRRFDLPKNLERLARVAVTTAPAPYGRLAAVRSKKYRHLAEASG